LNKERSGSKEMMKRRERPPRSVSTKSRTCTSEKSKKKIQEEEEESQEGDGNPHDEAGLESDRDSDAHEVSI
jgi:hypothetical protein